MPMTLKKQLPADTGCVASTVTCARRCLGMIRAYSNGATSESGGRLKPPSAPMKILKVAVPQSARVRTMIEMTVTNHIPGLMARTKAAPLTFVSGCLMNSWCLRSKKATPVLRSSSLFCVWKQGRPAGGSGGSAEPPVLGWVPSRTGWVGEGWKEKRGRKKKKRKEGKKEKKEERKKRERKG